MQVVQSTLYILFESLLRQQGCRAVLCCAMELWNLPPRFYGMGIIMCAKECESDSEISIAGIDFTVRFLAGGLWGHISGKTYRSS